MVGLVETMMTADSLQLTARMMGDESLRTCPRPRRRTSG